MNTKNGFTLVELLFVLGILTVLLLLAVPISTSSLEKQQEKQFLETFESDVLYIQAMASSTPNSYYKIKFYENEYELISGSGFTSSTIARQYPPGWKFFIRPFREISFKPNGSIRRAGTIDIRSEKAVYKAVFQPGKGRFYIARE